MPVTHGAYVGADCEAEEVLGLDPVLVAVSTGVTVRNSGMVFMRVPRMGSGVRVRS